MSAQQWTVFVTEDLAPWAAFTHGHVPIDDKSEAFRVKMVDLLIDQGCDEDEAFDAVATGTFGHFWMVSDPERLGDEDHPWFWCAEGTKGAVAITGMKFP